METTRFRAQTVEDAVAAARAAHGPDVEIVATQLVPARGLRGLMGLREVEVTVMVAREASVRRRPCDHVPSIGAAPAAAAQAGVLERLRLAGRRGAPPIASDRPDPLVAQLLSTGLDRELAVRVARSVTRGPRRVPTAAAIEAALATELGGLVSGDEAYAPVELFVGPPAPARPRPSPRLRRASAPRAAAG